MAPNGRLETNGHDAAAPVNHGPFDEAGLGDHERYCPSVVNGSVLCGNVQFAPSGALPVD